MKKFGQGMEWWLYLTREEYQVLMATSATLQKEGLISNEVNMDYLMRSAACYLNRLYGYEFVAVRIFSDEEFWTDEDSPIQPENIMSIQLLQMGGAPAYEEHFPTAISWMPNNCPEFPVEMLKDEWSRLQDMGDKAGAYAKQMPKETKEAFREMLAEHAEAAAAQAGEVH